MYFAPLQPSSDSEYFHNVWSRFFGQFIESGRDKAGLSVEQASVLAGIRTEEWTAIEAGAQLPKTRRELESMADTLGVEWATMVRIVFLYRDAWGLR